MANLDVILAGSNVTRADGEYRIQLKPERGRAVVIEARERQRGVVTVAAELAPWVSARSATAMRALLRLSFAATYVRASLSPDGRAAVIANLPLDSLTRMNSESVIGAVALFGDRLARASGGLEAVTSVEPWVWELTDAVERVHGAYVALDASETTRLVEETLTAAGLPCAPFAGALLTELDFGEPGVPPLRLTVSVHEGGVSFVAGSPAPKPGVDIKGRTMAQFGLAVGAPEAPAPGGRDLDRMAEMLAFNSVGGVVKAGFNSRLDTCLLFEVPSLYPRLLEDLRAELLPLMPAEGDDR